MEQLNANRRLYPRVGTNLPIQLSADGYDFATNTVNISCLGAYCRINRYIPPFTKIAIRLFFNTPENDGNKNADVECKGVIVRTEDSPDKQGFNIAIFFNDIKESQKQKISLYLSQFVS